MLRTTTMLTLALLWLPACGDDGGSADTAPAGTTEAGDDSGDGGPGESSDGGGPGSDSGGSTSAGNCVPPSGGVEQETVMLTTSDDKAIAATVARPTQGSCLPGLLLVHQFTLARSQWNPFLDGIVERGYVAVAIDLRGHGDSDPQDGALNELLSDPDQAPLDVAAGVEHLQAHEAVDATRLGVIGTSIGANLSVVAMATGLGVRAVAPISARLTAIQDLAGNPANLELSNVFCYAGEQDGGGAQAMTCTDLEGIATGDAQSTILPGTAAHGIAILQDFPETMPAILDWLDGLL